MIDDRVAIAFVLLPILLFGYAYVGYPLLLRLLSQRRKEGVLPADPAEWPTITISVPAYNEERVIGGTIDSLLALDYPADRKQILVVSDASTDRTDEIVRSYAGRGVLLHRMPVRAGKTAAENASASLCTGEIVVNTDATIRIPPPSLKPLIRVFHDATIGVASGRDISVGNIAAEGNQGESGYVDYEMKVRALETRMGSIVGASGCFYAIRRSLVQDAFPEALSRDFASALIAREAGYRAVSVQDAVCLVPRTVSLKREYNRKVRTMARGLETLWYKRHLMNPWREGVFAWMLISHKLVRWLTFPAVPFAFIGVFLLANDLGHAIWGLTPVILVLLLAAGAYAWPSGRRVPFVLALPGFVVGSVVAAVVAWSKALRGEKNPIWEPTRRPGIAG